MRPRLRFKQDRIRAFAKQYSYEQDDNDIKTLKPQVLERGHLAKEELAKVAHWKAPRSARHVQKNSEDYVSEITGFALSARTERARIEVLTNLDGVSWPTASVVLHFFHRDPYPIMDFRALWSVSLEVPAQYSFDFWWEYVQFCRSIASRNNVDMRTLDQALWQYSKEKQKRV